MAKVIPTSESSWTEQAAYSGDVWTFVRDHIPYNRNAWENYRHPAPIEGASGCIRVCMIHLEE
ncbi:MAG TPA: hypothetical protein PKN79_01015, partial [Sphaerochaeta sp.]|nr:hypothetical protein [Sphaerochaeta sp.]